MDETRLLLVDDHASFLRVVTRYLEQREGLRVAGTASTGCEALARAPDVEPDVILLDLRMPDVNGLDLIPQLQALLPTAAIVVLTLHDCNGYRQAALDAGADDFVSKQSIATDLVPTIQRVAHACQAQRTTDIP